MKKKRLSKTAMWWLILLAVIIIGAVFYGVLGVLVTIIIYFIISSIVFWGNFLGIMGCISQSFLKKPLLAEKFYKKAIVQKNTISYALSSYGLMLLRKGDTNTSLELFTRVYEGAGANVLMKKSGRVNQSLCYWQKGEIDKAIEILLDCEKEFEYINPDTYATLGYLYILKGNYDKALDYTNKALEDNNSHVSSLDNMGQIFYRQGDLEKAETYFKKAIEIKSTLADSQYYLGIISEENNNIELAKKYFQTAYNCDVNSFNTITKEQIEKKYFSYFKN